MNARTDPPILRLRAIDKRFGSTRALTGVNLTVRSHEIHAIMGENGAGKSTLMKILSGVIAPDAGEITLDGKTVTITGTSQARRLGINLIHQELAIAANLTVVQNIFLGSERIGRYGRLRTHHMAAEAQTLLASLGANFSVHTPCGELSIAEQQQVEIARALAHQGRILIMDEPTSSLSEAETQTLFALIERLRIEGMAILYISHRMAEVERLADRVTVLRDGHWIGELDAREPGGLARAQLVSMMVGRPLGDFYPRRSRAPANDDVVLDCRNVASAHVRPSNLCVKRGEVLGLAGLVGAGRTELARLIFGLDRLTGGQMTLQGQPYTPRSPAAAMHRRVAYLPEDRKQQGLFLEASVQTNLMAADLARHARHGLLDMAALSRATQAAIAHLHIRTPNADIAVGRLSGGNQQKVLLARMLAFGPQLLILDEPTRGVDIGAKTEIYRVISQLADAGLPIIFISSELPEVIGVADRVAVMREGRVVAELTGAAITQENILIHATDAADTADAAATI